MSRSLFVFGRWGSADVQNFNAALIDMTIKLARANVLIVNEALMIAEKMKAINTNDYFKDVGIGQLRKEELRKIIDQDKTGSAGKTKKPFYRKNERW